MSELVERYVHQVGRYVPQKERAEIEMELRSMIQDQLDDRFASSPSEAEVASVLAELGSPHQIAASYNSEQYLVGPELYPYMMMVLRHGWLIVPAIVVFLSIFGVLISSQEASLLNLIVEPVIAALQATLIFSAVVVLFFAILQRSDEKPDEKNVFDPLQLPKVDDPAVVDRAEITFGSAFGTFVVLILLYWLQVGGVTLRFNLADPGEVIPVSPIWILLLIAVSGVMIGLNLFVLRRNYWTARLYLVELVLEVLGVVGLYFVVYEPIWQLILAAIPSLLDIPFVDRAPEVVAVVTALGTLVNKGITLIKLRQARSHYTTSLAVKADG